MNPSYNPVSAFLAESDWNFDAIPDKELVACCYWEYARESAFIQKTLKNYNDWFLEGGKWDDDTPELNKNLETIQSIGHPSDVFLWGCAFKPDSIPKSDSYKKPDFPQRDTRPITGNFPASWQSLSQTEREHRAKIKTYVENLHIVPVKLSHWSWAKEIARECQHVADENHEQRKAWERKYLCKNAHGNFGVVSNAPPAPELVPIRPRTRWGVGETLMVDIAWDHFTNDEIVNYFRKWIKVARPEKNPAPNRQGHKPKDWRAKLTRLAALRLLSSFTASQLVAANIFPKIWETKQFSGDKWADMTKWRDARREAEKIFHTLFPFLPKVEKPLSWNRAKSVK